MGAKFGWSLRGKEKEPRSCLPCPSAGVKTPKATGEFRSLRTQTSQAQANDQYRVSGSESNGISIEHAPEALPIPNRETNIVLRAVLHLVHEFIGSVNDLVR